MADYISQFTGSEIDQRLAKVSQLETSKQDALVSGSNIKTINGESVLGSGDITAGDPNAVKYVAQTLTDEQKAQARTNIAAASAAELGQIVTSISGIEADIDSLEAAVQAINVGDYVTATTLPTASASTMGHIYLIGPDANNNYDRYFTQESGGAYSWVSLGSTQIDLSTYATKAEVTELEHKVDDISTGKYYGYYATAADLPDDATVDGFAYVGSGPTYTIYNCEGGVWTSTGITVNQSPVGNDEDIDQNEDGKLQFANRTYNAQQPNGMGYKILRKDATFASQVTETNTIFEIRYGFNLSGASKTLPSGCVLKFNGGKIQNGTLVGDDSAFAGNILFDDVVFSGTWTNEEVIVSSEHFITPHLDSICKSFANARVSLFMDITEDISSLNVNIEGNGHTITGNIYPAKSGNNKSNIIIKDTHIIGNIDSNTSSTIAANKTLIIENCKIKGFVNSRGTENERIINTEFYNDYTGGAGQTPSNDSVALLFYANTGTIEIKGCYFHNLFIPAVAGMNLGDTTLVNISYNVFDTIGGGACRFLGGIMPNLYFSWNTILNTNAQNLITGVTSEALNLHGFIRATVKNNYIDSQYSAVDCEGKSEDAGTDGDDRGHYLEFSDNRIVNCSGFLFYNIKHCIVERNNVNIYATSDAFCVALKCRNIEFKDNHITGEHAKMVIYEPYTNTGQSTCYTNVIMSGNYLEFAGSGGIDWNSLSTNDIITLGENSFFTQIVGIAKPTLRFLPDARIRKSVFSVTWGATAQRFSLPLDWKRRNLYKVFCRQIQAGTSRIHKISFGYTKNSAANVDEAEALVDTPTNMQIGNATREIDLAVKRYNDSQTFFLYFPDMTTASSDGTLAIEVWAYPEWCVPYI